MRVPDAPHAAAAIDVARELNVDPARGVPHDEVERRRGTFGANRLIREAGRPPWKIFAKQFQSIIVVLLAVAAGVAFVTRDAAEGFAICAVLLINSIVGFAIEWQSERALRKLRLQTHTQARVLRDGSESLVDSEDLVAGDVIFLEPGVQTPADARLLEAVNLQSEESALTGESIPVTKSAAEVASDARLPDRTSMVHLGTWITAG
ncbi:MAG TPA: cation-transporting P-type ATPase, partial [Vicinamibacterales bacterium]